MQQRRLRLDDLYVIYAQQMIPYIYNKVYSIDRRSVFAYI